MSLFPTKHQVFGQRKHVSLIDKKRKKKIRRDTLFDRNPRTLEEYIAYKLRNEIFDDERRRFISQIRPNMAGVAPSLPQKDLLLFRGGPRMRFKDQLLPTTKTVKYKPDFRIIFDINSDKRAFVRYHDRPSLGGLIK